MQIKGDEAGLALYSLIIEPLLVRLRGHLRGQGLPEEGHGASVIVPLYALSQYLGPETGGRPGTAGPSLLI